MKVRHSVSRSLPLGILILGLLRWAPAPAYAQDRPRPDTAKEPPKEVSYVTEDGWTIYGTLFLPKEAARAAVPGVIVLSEPGKRNRDVNSANLARAVRDKGMAVLTIDLRGTGSSYGKKDFEVFSPQEIDAMQLDIRGAVKFLSDQKNIDGSRIAVAGADIMAEYVVREASQNPSQIQAVVLASAKELSRNSKNYIASRSNLPVFALVGVKESKKLQELAAAPYFASQDPDSTILFGTDRGAGMFGRPPQVAEKVADWLDKNVKRLGRVSEVSFKSQDGWALHGNLYLPDLPDTALKVPGVVFLHGFHHEQQTWHDLAREVVKTGKAALIFDVRGNRKSINQGKGKQGVDLPPSELAKIYLDAKAAVELMASQKEVDASRLALVAGTAACNQAVRAAIGDSRIKTIVALSFYAPDPDVKKFISTNDVPLFLAATLGDLNADGGNLAETTKEVYKLSKSKESQLLLFDDAGRGTNMLDEKPEVRPMIVRWLDDKLAN